MTKMRKVKAIKIDSGYLNALVPAQVRGRMSNYSSEMMAGTSLLSEPVLEASYIHNDVFRNICDVPAEEMTRAGFELEGISEKEQQAIKSKIEELDAMERFSEAIKWRFAYGGGLMLLGLNDGGLFEDELNEKSLSDIEFIKVYDRFECRPERYYDTQDKNFGKVELWQISPRDGTQQFLVHSSRVFVFDGQTVPNSVRKSNDGWGASVIQTCFKKVIRLDTGYKYSLDLLQRMQQAVHKIPQLSQELAEPTGEANVMKRVNVVDTVRGLYNTIILDSLEEYDITSFALTGVKDVVTLLAEAVSSACRMPVFIFIGKTEGGLNSNGESSKEGWYTQVGAWQNQQLRKPLDRLITLIQIIETKGKDDGGNYTLKFNPLYTMTDAQKADVDLKKEQTQ
jgi:phage-related protein (TIGR01555 family)